MSTYAIISLGGKQYRVQEGERLLVDRLKLDEGATVQPRVLLVGGDGSPDLAPSTTVTARVVSHELGDKIRIGKYRRRTGYKRHTGFRSSLTRIEIESIGAAKRAKAAAKAEAGSAGSQAAAAQRKDRAPDGARGAETAPKTQKAEKPDARQAAAAPDVAAMTIAQIGEAAAGWSKAELEAALGAERSGKARKGALAALESALEEK
jgi:large subunit ribosomal protein L21